MRTPVEEIVACGEFDPKDPDALVVARVWDNGDGTHTRETFEKGRVVNEETFAVDTPAPATLTAEEKVAELAALLVEKGVATEAEVASKLVELMPRPEPQGLSTAEQSVVFHVPAHSFMAGVGQTVGDLGA